ncbi:GGDEF domain-containing protein [Shinella sp. CPCC 101442]|uniref:GGDEF domain-containing protein n=1 Tax=Shinella sp. CPCC 101442 TaxID=2932265 RepID=UPI00215339C1|nr:GGDEF domain-containing protein [Shinella sp. CPCC 101442]MCR6499614.1 GGDEF domain-containing protein [Shinella sp. CPCC 101442]
MIEDLISISTLMICTFLSTIVVGIFMLQVWLTDRRHAAAGYWCLSMWVGSVCTLLFALRAIGYPMLTVGFANMLATLGYALMWAGFRVFDRRRAYPLVVLAGPVLWSAAYLFVPQISADVNNRIILSSAIISAYSVWMGVDIWRGRRGERLPTRTLSAIFFLSHGIIYSLRIPMAIVSPAPLGNGTAHSAWFALFSLELFAHTILAAVAMLVLIKERGEALYRQASRTDALTGIANRGSFFEDTRVHLAARSEGTLMIFDLDRFKAINDTHGHVAGDTVLKRFSARISASLEEGMLFCRFGGEEFALFAPRHDIARAEHFAERLRQDVAALSILSEGREIGVSVSIGLADVATFGADFDRLHSAADGALYAAKEAGRNLVMRATPAATLSGFAERMRSPSASSTGIAAAR